MALATSSTWLLADSIQEKGSCLDKGPCGFGRQLVRFLKVSVQRHLYIAANQHFISDSLQVQCTVLDMHTDMYTNVYTCTYSLAAALAHTAMQNM